MSNAKRIRTPAPSPSKARRDREKAKTRRLILEAARELFTQQGYAQTSMRRIADQIGYTATAIYHHFRDKDALLNELCLLDFRALGEALQEMGQIPDPLERLRLMGQNYVRFALNHPQQFRFMFLVERPIPGPDQVTIDPAEDGYAFLLKNIKEGFDLGLFRPELDDPEMLAQIVWYGYRIGELSCPTKYFEEASSINFRRSVVYGLGVLKTALDFRLCRMGVKKAAIFR